MADRPERDDVSPMILAAAMIGGGLVGFAIWMATGMFVFLPVFLGAGLTVGLAMGLARGTADRGDADS
jgi:hypothetical protein